MIAELHENVLVVTAHDQRIWHLHYFFARETVSWRRRRGFYKVRKILGYEGDRAWMIRIPLRNLYGTEKYQKIDLQPSVFMNPTRPILIFVQLKSQVDTWSLSTTTALNSVLSKGELFWMTKLH
ncbi:hypothetical protein BGZ98_009277 [Dissophora globulifera]|nr:hypothetical protein BGZ98_009277 [Dissophora globulifera]